MILPLQGGDREGDGFRVVRVRGKTLNEELIRAEMAWVYIEYCKQPICLEWSRLQEKARKKKRGSWADRNNVPPWTVRNERKGVP